MRQRSTVVTVALAAVLSGCGRTVAPPSAAHAAAVPRLSSTSSIPIVVQALDRTVGRPLVDPAEIRSGGPGVDGIPAIDHPLHLTAAEAGRSLVDSEQVLLIEHAGEARAFPLRSLGRHEIANDIVGGLPVAATWCPLCNTGVAYDRRVTGTTTTFGVTGTLYRSAMVMYDRASRSLWTQPTGQAVAGPRTGTELAVLPSSLLSWAQARRTYPALSVTLANRSELAASTNPYEGYDTSSRPFLFHGRLDPRLPPFERVAGVSLAGQSQAWSFALLRTRRVIAATVGGRPLVVFWSPGASSPLDTSDIRQGRNIGATGVYRPQVDSRPLTFTSLGEDFRDDQTHSTWSIGGLAVAGPLHGRHLERLPSQEAFWFAWAAFNPTTGLTS